MFVTKVEFLSNIMSDGLQWEVFFLFHLGNLTISRRNLETSLSEIRSLMKCLLKDVWSDKTLIANFLNDRI